MLLPAFITWNVNKSDVTATDKKKKAVSPEIVLCSPGNEDGWKVRGQFSSLRLEFTKALISRAASGASFITVVKRITKVALEGAGLSFEI